VTLSSDGRRIASQPGGGAEVTEEEVWAAALETYQIGRDLMVAGLIIPAFEAIRAEHHYDFEYLSQLCVESSNVPTGHMNLWASGLRAGFDGEFGVAACILAPQLEHWLRSKLKERDFDTIYIDPASGDESEKGLGALLLMAESRDFLGERMHAEIRSLCSDPRSDNLRNSVAHGFFNDQQGLSAGAVYLWWLVLRIVVTPLLTDSASGATDPS